ASAGSQACVPGADPGLALWHPAATVDASLHAAGASRAWWVESDGLIQHVVGPQDQFLLFDYPLTGRFEFSVEAFIGGWAEGHLSYGGLVAEANANYALSDIYPVGRNEIVPLPSRLIAGEAFNRMTVRVEPGKVGYYVNGHLFYEETDPSPTAPWLALFCSRERQSTFRNLTLSGAPVIPRSVSLTVGNRLEGWVSSFHVQT